MPGAKIGGLILESVPANRRLVSTKVSRDFDVIRPVSGSVPDCFLFTARRSVCSVTSYLTHVKTSSSEGKIPS